MSGPRVLFIDLETSHDILAKFGLREEYVSPENILQDWFVFSGAWKWRGQDYVHGAKISKVPDDRALIKKLYAEIEKADCIVAHNGDRFDLKAFRTRAIMQGLPPLPLIRTRDTLKIAKKHFRFASNKLDFLCSRLDLPQKIKTSEGLWIKALMGDKAALDEMMEYNKADIPPLEALFDKLEPWDEPAINMAIGEKDICCPSCGSIEYRFDGYGYSSTGKIRRYCCKICGKKFRQTTAAARARVK